MDERTDKHALKALRIDAQRMTTYQRMTTNIHVGTINQLLLFYVFLLLSATDELGKLI